MGGRCRGKAGSLCHVLYKKGAFPQSLGRKEHVHSLVNEPLMALGQRAFSDPTVRKRKSRPRESHH